MQLFGCMSSALQQGQCSPALILNEGVARLLDDMERHKLLRIRL
jgi:hypothetical protein